MWIDVGVAQHSGNGVLLKLRRIPFVPHKILCFAFFITDDVLTITSLLCLYLGVRLFSSWAWEAVSPSRKTAPYIVPLASMPESAYCDICFGAGVLNVPGEAS